MAGVAPVWVHGLKKQITFFYGGIAGLHPYRVHGLKGRKGKGRKGTGKNA